MVAGHSLNCKQPLLIYKQSDRTLTRLFVTNWKGTFLALIFVSLRYQPSTDISRKNCTSHCWFIDSNTHQLENASYSHMGFIWLTVCSPKHFSSYKRAKHWLISEQVQMKLICPWVTFNPTITKCRRLVKPPFWDLVLPCGDDFVEMIVIREFLQ